MSWDLWGTVKIRGIAADLCRFTDNNKGLLDRTFGTASYKGNLLETFTSDIHIKEGFIFWHFLTWSFDGEEIIHAVSGDFPDLEFHSRFGSDEHSWFIECFIKNGKTEDIYKKFKSVDDFTDITVVVDESNDEYRFEKVEWDTLNITYNHTYYAAEHKPE